MSAQHSGPVLAERDGLRVIKCRACGWAHLDPLPTVRAGYYESEFWQTKGSGWLARYEAERDWLDMRHADWLSVIEQHTAGRELLDIGCGYGFFLKVARSLSWHIIGIEPSAEANAYATKQLLTVHDGTWDNFDHPELEPYCFDCVSAFWLLEHLPDPRVFLAWCRAHLAPGGVLAVCVPQEWTALQASANLVAGIKNYWLHPTHLNYWSAATLYSMLGRAGFRVVDALASWPIDKYISRGFDYTGDDKIGDKVHAIIRTTELKLSQDTRLEIGRRRALRSSGRDLLVIAKADA